MYIFEYVFEKVLGNVVKGVVNLGISYLIVFDNNYVIWINYWNCYWFVEYLIDVIGMVWYIKFGEGDYNVIEMLVR